MSTKTIKPDAGKRGGGGWGWERGERERKESERETRVHEALALHAPIHWAIRREETETAC